MLIVIWHRWAGIRVSRGLWTARTIGFVTVERLPGDSPIVRRISELLAGLRARVA